MSNALGLLVLVACRTPLPPPPTDASFAPTLFTVDHLRDGNPKGRIIEFRIENEGQPPVNEQWEFVAVDRESATVRAISKNDAGDVVADRTDAATWTELHSHGKFLASSTTITDGVVLTVPAGTFTTRLYTVRGAGIVRKLWFATELPGPPVQFTTERNGAIVSRTVMLRAR